MKGSVTERGKRASESLRNREELNLFRAATPWEIGERPGERFHTCTQQTNKRRTRTRAVLDFKAGGLKRIPLAYHQPKGESHKNNSRPPEKANYSGGRKRCNASFLSHTYDNDD